GVHVVERVMEKVKRQVQGTDANEPGRLQGLLRQTLLDVFTSLPSASLDELITKGPKPFVILAVGVNGVGKTTTLAKMAQRLVQAGKVPLLVAGDTFRAAAIDQLQVWADRIGVGLIRHPHGPDPAAGALDGLAAAQGAEGGCPPLVTHGTPPTESNLHDAPPNPHP